MLEQKPAASLPSSKAKSAKKGRRGWRRLRNSGLLVIFVLLVGLGVTSFFTFRSVVGKANSGAAHFQAAQDQLKSEGGGSFNKATLERIQQELAAAQSDFRQARESVGPFSLFLPLVGWLPGPAYDAANLMSFLAIAEKSAQLGLVMLDGVRPAADYLEPGNQTEGGAAGKLSLAAEALALPEAQTSFTKASALLNEVIQQRAGLDRAKLSLNQTQKAIDQLDGQLPTLKDVLGLMQDLPSLLPRLLGKDTPVNYLVLIQNSDELRPTGGFISATGLITLNRGKLSLANFQDSYAVDNPKLTPATPPEALARYMQAGYFLLRDSNWWPDFPTSAKHIAEYYQQHQTRSVDSVVAIDSQAVAYLFEALGPLDLPAYNERLTAQNFEERLRYYYLPPNTARNDEWWLKRKEFIGVVLNGLLSRLNGASARDYIKVATQLGQAVNQKHLQIYFNDPDLQTQLARRQLDGALLNQSANAPLSDYLMVADTNVGFNKINPKIERSMSYRVVQGGSGATIFASLTLTYTNRGSVREGTSAGECVKVVKYDSDYQSMMNGCYWNYLRVYVPEGSNLRQASGFPADASPTTSRENGKTVFASQLIVPPGATVSVTLDYLLPNALAAMTDHQLIMQKQAGSKPAPLTVQFNWPGFSRSWNTTLDDDLSFDAKMGVTKQHDTKKLES